MDTGHTGSHRFEGGDVPLYVAKDVPRFRHKADGYKLPRYWTALGTLWLGCLVGGVHDLIYAVHGTDLDRWDAVNLKTSLMWFSGVWLTSLLWKSWHREEQYPELLPDDEFDARFPPSAGAPPTTSRRYTEEITPTGGTTHQLRADGSCGTPSHEHR